MPYAPHTLVSFGGSLGNGVFEVAGSEIWQCGVRVCEPGGIQNPLRDPKAYMNALAPLLETWFQGPSACTNSAALEWLKVNNINAAGKYSSPTNTNRLDFPANVFGPDPGTVPFILTTVTTWRTSRKRGPGSHGRIYLPNNTLSGGEGMVLTPAACDHVVSAGVQLIHILRDTDGTQGATPVVASNVDASLTPITQVAAGNVLDVQRRRKDALQESYRTANV